jgi:hypothetical protein
MPINVPSEVDSYLSTLPPDQHKTITALQDAILSAAATLDQRINPWGYVAFGTATVKFAFVLVPHAKHINFQILNGAEIIHALPKLQGTGKKLRHIKFRYDEPVDAALVAKAVRLALAA